MEVLRILRQEIRMDMVEGCGILLRDGGDYFYYLREDTGEWKSLAVRFPYATSSHYHCGRKPYLCERCARKLGIVW